MKKILVIEDSPSIRDDITEMLDLSGYSVITASDGKTGIEKTLAESPDLILCDITMPGIDGYGVLHILSRHPESHNIPFIFLTGRKELSELRKGMGMGADDYLIKPFEESDLLNAIELRLKKSQHIKRNLTEKGIDLEELILNLKSSNPAEQNEVRKYKKKHLVYEEGQRASVVYYVKSGKLKEYRLHEDGKELIINMYTRGDFIGYAAVLENIPYSETVQVIDDAELILIPRDSFIEMINSDVNITKQFMEMLSHNLRIKEDKLLGMAYDTLRKKVASGIIEVADKFKNQKDGINIIEISREDLAHVVGSAPESMIRTLKEFRDEKLIDIQNGAIVILNEQKLRSLPY